MSEVKVSPYGTWASPITAGMVAASSLRLLESLFDGDDVYWLEMRPAEAGRYALVRRRPGGSLEDVLPASYSVRTRVHEYGGGAFLAAEGAVYFCNDADQRMYHQPAGGEPQPLTPAGPWRYADAILDRRRNRLICVREDHGRSDREALNEVVAIDLATGGAGVVLCSGRDFYASPRLNPDGSRLAWLSWSHPNMPWDGAELWVGELSAGGHVKEARLIAGGPSESIFGPEWSPTGELYFVSDRSGWWNLYRCNELDNEQDIEALAPMEAEFGMPQWVFRMSTYAFESAGRLVCAFQKAGVWRLACLDTKTLDLQSLALPFTDISEVRAAPGRALLRAGSPTQPTSIILVHLEDGRREILRQSADVRLDAGYLSVPQAIEFPTERGLSAYGLFYRPRNRDFVAPAGDLPLLIVKSHGGPTGAATSTLSLAIQYWTSRGFAVLDVNYGGSVGYGRGYRQRLAGRWGVVDVDDCVYGARYLVEQGLVDPERLIIAGSSAGGYTTLAALTFRDVFRAGASYYGIGDLEALAQETHKFESRYLDNLVGPYPERRDIYLERSPVHHAERLSCPVIFFQGLEDKVVPPAQAENMAAALRARGVPVAYVAFEGEQHGFRRAENIRRALEAELYFYGRVFGFTPADAVEPLPIDNLD